MKTIDEIIKEFIKRFGHVQVIKNELSGNQYDGIINFIRTALTEYKNGIKEGLDKLDFYTTTILPNGDKIKLISKEDFKNYLDKLK